ncbi:MAG: DUF5615 family PIN-like protein [Planctomycetes bacterium]|nr:DUF5615 family PIN-like protein [Planctomycetota bacterium]
MQFKVDENLPVEVARLLDEHGHDARTVHEQGLAGGKDKVIAGICLNEKRALITLDTDFADIRTYPPADFFGLVVLRLKRQDESQVLSAVARLVKILDAEALVRHLWIVEENNIRISGGGDL